MIRPGDRDQDSLFIQFDDWQFWAELAPWLDDRFHASVLERFTEDAAPTWIDWLDNEQSKLTGPEDSTELFLEHLDARFAGVRLYHVTKLPDPDSLRQDGLRAWSPDDLREMARHQFRAAPSDDLERAIRLSNPDHRGGRVYTFLLLRDASPDRCRSFATHGSEWLHAVAVDLDARFAEELRTRNKAYLVALDIPWSMLETSTRLQLAQYALLATIVRRFFPDKNYGPAPRGTCVSLDRDVPASCIASIDELDNFFDQHPGCME